MKQIGDKCFYSCKQLRSINIPANVTKIGKGAFAMCDALEQVEISEKNKRFVLEDGTIKDRTGKNGDVKIGGPLEYCY